MLSSFRKAYLLHYFLGFIFIVVCWIPTFIISQETIGAEVFQYDSILKAGLSNVYLLNGLALFITLISSLISNHLTTEFGLTGKLMTFGVFFFSILAVSISSFTIMNPYILINFFLFFFIRNIFCLPNSENPIPLVFNASLILSIASFYFFDIVFLIVIIWIGLLIHRSGSWRNYLASLIGLLVPYFFILTWYYWSDQLQDYLLLFTNRAFIGFYSPLSIRIPDLIIVSIIAVLLVIGVFKTIFRLNEKSINLRRNIIVTIYYLFTTILIFILFAPGSNASLIIVLPATLIMSNAFSDLRDFKWYNIVFSILLGMIVINQYLKFFI